MSTVSELGPVGPSSRVSSAARAAAPCLVSTAAAFALLARAAPGQGWETFKIEAPSGNMGQAWGTSLAVDGDYLAGGAPWNSTKASEAGVVFLYKRDPQTGDWTLKQEIHPSDPEKQAHFGRSVAMSGNVLVVGAPDEDNANGTDAGAAYVFRLDAASDTWNQEQKLTASVGAASDVFGWAVAVQGTLLVVGTPFSDTSQGNDTGSASVYRYDDSTLQWQWDQALIDSNGAAGDNAGLVVEIVSTDSELVAVGSPYADDSNYIDSGKVNLWEPDSNDNSWRLRGTHTSPFPADSSIFGASIAADGFAYSTLKCLIIGEPFHDDSAAVPDSGAAHIYSADDGLTFELDFSCLPEVPQAGARFGSSVDVRDTIAIAGSPTEDSAGLLDNGGLWTYRKGKAGWANDQRLGLNLGGYFDHLGEQLVLTEDQILASAPFLDTAGGRDLGGLVGYPTHDMNLTIEPTAPPPGTQVTFSGFYGTPGDLCMVTIEEIDGQPYFIPFIISSFDNHHALKFSAVTPPITYGITIGCNAYKISETGPVVGSSRAYVDL